MPELVSLTAVSPSLRQTPPQSSPTTQASPALTLPPLAYPADSKFLAHTPLMAGRRVIIELQTRPGDSREARQSLWKAYQNNGNSLQKLGLAAQTLERCGVNWRQARNPKEILEAFRALLLTQTN